MKKLDKIYLVIGTESPVCGEGSFVAKVFAEKELAEKYAELQDEIEKDNYSFYVAEEKIEYDFDINSKVANYYNFYIGKDIAKSINDIFYNELKSYLQDNKLLSAEQLDQVIEIEKKDLEVDEFNNKSYKQVYKYLNDNLTKDKIDNIIKHFNDPDIRYYNDEDVETRLYDKDLVVEEDNTYIQAFSINSFKEAKEAALKRYENWYKNQ